MFCSKPTKKTSKQPSKNSRSWVLKFRPSAVFVMCIEDSKNNHNNCSVSDILFSNASARRGRGNRNMALPFVDCCTSPVDWPAWPKGNVPHTKSSTVLENYSVPRRPGPTKP